MNTSRLKNFAPSTRAALLEQVAARLDYLLDTDSVELREISKEIGQLRSAVAREGKEALVNRVAYSWFNRFAALRFMDAHGFHPSKLRILTAIDGFTQPEVLQQARAGELSDSLAVDQTRINDLLSGRVPSSDPVNEVYRHLIIASCRALTDVDPTLFPNATNDAFSALLLPVDLLSSNSVLAPFREEITDEDCAEVEILGWLYQFYISEKKDEVMARKKAVPTEDIPYVTQLFTPNWIVRYMVENSLGRLWLQNRPSSSLAEHMPYFIPEEPGDSLAECKIEGPEDIKILDPAVGSGHILSYAFDLLYRIYEEEGHTPSEIPGLILENNLYGIDLCPRAAQLAELSLLFKARQKSRRFFNSSKLVRPNIMTLRNVSFEEGELAGYAESLDLGSLFTDPVLQQLDQFEEATTFGSLIQPVLDAPTLADLKQRIASKDLGSELFLKPTHDKVLRVIAQAEMLLQRYHCVIANPPYMGGKGMNPDVKKFLASNYKDYKSDLFAAFTVRSLTLAVNNGYLGFMTPFVWMFISSYEKLRKTLTIEATLTSLVQLEYSGFEGATVPICTFTLQNASQPDYRGGFVRLSDYRGAANQGPKALEIIAEARMKKV